MVMRRFHSEVVCIDLCTAARNVSTVLQEMKTIFEVVDQNGDGVVQVRALLIFAGVHYPLIIPGASK